MGDLISTYLNYRNMESTTEVSNLEMNVTLECPEYSQETGLLVEEFAFWIEGVCLCLIAIPGIFGNCLSSYILAGKSMRNSFNLLLIGLAMYDNTYLVCAMLESIRKRFSFQTDIHILLFPYFLYPLHMMAMTGSILMTVAIALERYSAVHWPIAYSQVSVFSIHVSILGTQMYFSDTSLVGG